MLLADGLDGAAPIGPAAGARIKVLVVECRRLVADALAVALSIDESLEVVGTQTDALLAADDVRRTRPDVALVDYGFTRPAGAEITAALRAEFPQLRIIVLTPGLDEDSLVACIQAGAFACVSTAQPSADLVRSIKRVHAGEVLFAPELLLDLLTQSRHLPGEPQARPASQALGPRELEVLRTLATGMSTGEAATRLDISVHTVRTHLKNVMAKLEARSKLEAVMIALRNGLIELPR